MPQRKKSPTNLAAFRGISGGRIVTAIRPLFLWRKVGIVCPMDVLTKFALPAATLLMLAACGRADNEPGPGGVSVGEARALDEAAEMVEAKRLPQNGPDSGTEDDGPKAQQ